MIKKFFIFFSERISSFFLHNHIKFFKNKTITIFSNDCIAGTLYHDLKMQFASPTINLSISIDHFIAFCSKIEYYTKQKLTPISNKDYPIMSLGNNDDKIIIKFVHYKTYEEAEKSWNRRCKRITPNTIYVIDVFEINDTIFELIKNSPIPHNRLFVITKGDKYSKYPFVHESLYYNSIVNNDGKLLSYSLKKIGKRNYYDTKIHDFLVTAYEES